MARIQTASPCVWQFIMSLRVIPRWNWIYSSAMWITNDKKLFKIITQRCKPPTAQWLTIPYVVCKINLAVRGKFEILEYLKVDAQHSKQAKIYQPQIDKAISQTPACDLDQKWLKPRFPFSLHGFFVLESLHDRAPKTRENENAYALRYLWGQSRTQ